MSSRKVIQFLIGTRQPAWIVDASKTAYMSFWRPAYYKLLGYQVVIIHLVRSPRAVMMSALMGTNKELEGKVEGKRRFVRPRTLVGWTFANFVAAVYRVTFSKSVLIEFEDLTSDPRRELRRIEALTSLDLGPVAALIDARSPLPGGHEIAGNRALRAGEMVLRASERCAMSSAGLGWRCFATVARAFGSSASRL